VYVLPHSRFGAIKNRFKAKARLRDNSTNKTALIFYYKALFTKKQHNPPRLYEKVQPFRACRKHGNINFGA
jgi:hypothetical protein